MWKKSSDITCHLSLLLCVLKSHDAKLPPLIHRYSMHQNGRKNVRLDKAFKGYLTCVDRIIFPAVS